MVADYYNVFQGLSYASISVIGEYLMNSFKRGEYDKIEIVYNEFKNVATQILRIEQFLPVQIPEKKQNAVETDYIYLPDQSEIVTGLIPKALKIQLFKSVLDSNAAENGARMTAMDKATENAGDLLKDLKLTYNRTRQAAITKEILEIVAGAEALKAS
jgi:F-type H+-transporting ATPase subunit gamma